LVILDALGMLIGYGYMIGSLKDSYEWLLLIDYIFISNRNNITSSVWLLSFVVEIGHCTAKDVDAWV
jgi:hypothetical protein